MKCDKCGLTITGDDYNEVEDDNVCGKCFRKLGICGCEDCGELVYSGNINDDGICVYCE